MVRKSLIEDSDHGRGEEAPGKELEEDHHQGMVDRSITCNFVELWENMRHEKVHDLITCLFSTINDQKKLTETRAGDNSFHFFGFWNPHYETNYFLPNFTWHLHYGRNALEEYVRI